MVRGVALLALLAAGCARDASPERAPAPPGMVWVPGGEFTMGCADPRGTPGGGNDPMADARPLHRVAVAGFWLDATEVTNEQFAAFVAATGWTTIAERTPTEAELPDVPAELRVAGSIVFAPPATHVALDDPSRWWRFVPGACWRHPEGPGSDLAGRGRHPVVHVAYEDALAYARFAGKRLPTEAEWELAARGGLEQARFAWGEEFQAPGAWRANLFQGEFPWRDGGDDGFAGTAPVASFAANGRGLHDVAGNVWEWCADLYRADAYARRAAAGAIERDPAGPADSFDPDEPGVAKRVLRGGSFLCDEAYCARYLVGARGKAEPASSASHIGFRCARDGAPR